MKKQDAFATLLKGVRFGFFAGTGLFMNNAVQAQKPNLLFIITDQQRFDALSIAGNTQLLTPNLDRLAQQGAFFKKAYTQCAVSGPTRASLLTGCTVENHGVLTNELTGSAQSTGIMAQPTFDQILKESGGYHVEYYGKWHSPQFAGAIYQNPVLISPKGRSIFAAGGSDDMYAAYLDPIFPVAALKPGELYDTFTKRPYLMNPMDYRYGMTEAEAKAAGGTYASPSQPDLHGVVTIPTANSHTAYWANQTIAAIERNKNIPFSITCSFHFPHAPMLPVKYYSDMFPVGNLTAPASIGDPKTNSPYYSSTVSENSPYADPIKIKYMISDYYALVKECDDWIGKILDKLDAVGLTDNTMVIFVSDHGEMLGSHGMREKNVFYEESAHVPLLVKFPGRIAAGTVVNDYTTTMNLFPTILDYLNMPASPSDGISLRGLMEGTDTSSGKYVVTEWLYNGDARPGYMILKDGWKMFIPFSTTSTVVNGLYNLTNDPYEVTNLLGTNPNRFQYYAKVEELRTDLLRWLKTHKSSHYNGVRDRDLMISNASTALIGVTLSEPTALLSVGSTTQLTASVSPSNTPTKTVTWTSSNLAVATVSATGLITGKAVGDATITATTTSGAKTAVSAITVTATNTNAAAFLQQTVPETMAPGQTATVSLSMKNTGTTMWTSASGIKLASLPSENTTWGSSQVALGLSESVGVNATKNFSFTITAPATEGTYDFEWRMLQGTTDWFGDASTALKIVVAVPIQYTLTVNGGTGSTICVAGAIIPIVAAEPPAGKVFDKWVVNAGVPIIANVDNASTTLTMPNTAATVTASYKLPPLTNCLDNCDLKTGWLGSTTLTLNTTDEKEGVGCIEFSGTGTDEFKKVFGTPYNSGVTASNGVLKFWCYISDPSLFSSRIVELGSAGVPDMNEYSWKLTGLAPGWNYILLQLSNATTSGGVPNLNAINWFRMYSPKTASVTTRIDAIEVTVGTTESIIQQASHYTVFPNPVTDMLFINGLEGVAKVSVLNVTGEEIYTSQTTQSVSMKNRAPGFYFLKIGKDKPIKFVKK
ncbi:MAG: sulfatase-like hydrolase/transferase [Bacteroidia bacterium]|nr:sulfatase-like hydrolase/transferase [Bacteroidia bacterium]